MVEMAERRVAIITGAGSGIGKATTERFSNDPKNVANVIFRIAEGDIKKNTVLVGLDAKIGRILYLLTYPLTGYRFDILFFGGSFMVYKLAELKERLRKK